MACPGDLEAVCPGGDVRGGSAHATHIHMYPNMHAHLAHTQAHTGSHTHTHVHSIAPCWPGTPRVHVCTLPGLEAAETTQDTRVRRAWDQREECSERDRETETERDRETEGDREKGRQRIETERDREKQTQRDGNRAKERERGRSQCLLPPPLACGMGPLSGEMLFPTQVQVRLWGTWAVWHPAE